MDTSRLSLSPQCRYVKLKSIVSIVYAYADSVIRFKLKSMESVDYA